TVTNLEAAAVSNQVTFAVSVSNPAGTSSLSSNAVITIVADTDGDGLPDDWERFYNMDPTDPSDAAQDIDIDGVSNLDEYRFGSDPVDRETIPSVFLVAEGGTPPRLALLFTAYAEKTYTVLWRDSLDHGEWLPIADVPATPMQRLVILRDLFAHGTTPG